MQVENLKIYSSEEILIGEHNVQTFLSNNKLFEFIVSTENGIIIGVKMLNKNKKLTKKEEELISFELSKLNFRKK